jgi:hypothetical protein
MKARNKQQATSDKHQATSNMHSCWIRSPHHDGCGDFYILGYNAVRSGEGLPTFRNKHFLAETRTFTGLHDFISQNIKALGKKVRSLLDSRMLVDLDVLL